MQLWKTSTILILLTGVGLGTSLAQSPNGNTIMGDGAGQSLSGQTGSYNVLLGRQAGNGLRTGNYNMLIGNGAGQATIGGQGNVSIGDGAGLKMTNDRNTFLGQWAGMNTTTATQNVMVGVGAGINNATGSYNTFVGPFAGPDNSKPGLQYATAIGAYAQVSVNNSIILGGTKDAGGQPITINVGIGTSTPGTLLDIAGNFRTTTGRFSSIYSQNTDGTYPTNVVNIPGDAQLSIGANWTSGKTDLSLINSNIGNTSGGGFSFWQMTGPNSKKALAYFQGNGNVGIGTTEPTQMLHVANGDAIVGGIGNFSGVGTQARVFLGDPANWVGAVFGARTQLTGWNGVSLGTSPNGTYTERLVIDAAGKVGIGITTPIDYAQLHVHGTGGIISTGAGSQIRIRDQKSTRTTEPWLDEWAWYATDNISRFHRPGLGDVMAFNATGAVGIGNIAPASKLHITGGGLSVGSNITAQNTDGYISLGNAALNSTPTTANWIGGTTMLLTAQDYTTIGFHDVNNRVDFIRSGNGKIELGYDGGWGPANIGLPSGVWGNNGNVGIGTTNPGIYKLAVEGKIGAREVEVKAGAWADFVFAKNYKLPSLQSVEEHIAANKHLPGIPSEAEVKRDGYALGAMDAKLLQKIEELTLYVIEQQKRIEKLEQQLASLGRVK